MNKGLRDYLDSIGATPVNPETLAEYGRAMREEVIPAIERDLKAQRRAAHFARLGIPDPLASAMSAQQAETPQEAQGRSPASAVAATGGETPTGGSNDRR